MGEQPNRCPIVLVDDGSGAVLAMGSVLAGMQWEVVPASLAQVTAGLLAGLEQPLVVTGGETPLDRWLTPLAAAIDAVRSGGLILVSACPGGPALARRLGAIAHLSLPVEPEALILAVSTAAELRSARLAHFRLQTEEAAQSGRVAALLRALDRVNSHLDLEEVTRCTVESAVAITHAQRGYVALATQGYLRMKEYLDGKQWILDPIEWQIGTGIPGWVWMSKSSLVGGKDDIETHANAQISLRLRRQSFICVPIVDRSGQVVGVIEVINRRDGGRFTDADVAMVEGLGRHVSIAINNARHVGDLQEAHRRLVEAETQKRQFHRDVMLAATGGKLILCDAWELNPSGWANAAVPVIVRALCDVGKARNRLTEILSPLGMDETRAENFRVACGEAVTNALLHGGGGSMSVQVLPDRVVVKVADRGRGIESLKLPQATLQPGVSLTGSLGMGFSLILGFVDKLFLCTGSDGTTLILECFLNCQDATMPFFDLEAFSDEDRSLDLAVAADEHDGVSEGEPAEQGMAVRMVTM